MKYVYWAVQCKTQGCPQVHYAKEIGESTKHPLTQLHSAERESTVGISFSMCFLRHNPQLHALR